MASTSDDVSIDYDVEVSADVNKEDSDSIESIFYKKLLEYDNMHSGSNKKPWTQERISEVIADLKNIRVTMKKKSVDYYWMSKYDVVTTADEEYLIPKKKHPTEPTVRIVAREQYFDLLSLIHISCGHAGRDKMLQELKTKFYVPKKAVEIFVSLCPICENRKYGGHKCENNIGRPVKPSNQKEGGQFSLIDFQSCPDGEYRWLLNYQNMVSKFTILRPLKTINTDEVAAELLKIFLTFGAPCTLQSKLGKDFTVRVLKELSTMWPDSDITCSVHRNTEQNADIETLLQSWMKEKNSKNWSFGCFYVQYFKNTSFHPSLGKLPFEALFGCVPKTGLIPSTFVDKEVTTKDGFTSIVNEELTIGDVIISSSTVNQGVNIGDRLTSFPIVNEGVKSGGVVKISVTENNRVKTGGGCASSPAVNKEVTIRGVIKTEEVMLEDDVKPNFMCVEADGQLSNQSEQQTQEEPIHNSKIKLEMDTQNDSPDDSSSENDFEQKNNLSPTLPSENQNQKFKQSSTLPREKENESSNAFKCKSCNSTTHIIRGVIDDSEGRRLKVSCCVCKSEQDMELVSRKTLKRAVEAPMDEPASKMPTFDVGNSVMVDVPITRRGPLNTKTVKGKIVDYRNGVYRVATKIGTIKNWFSRYDLQHYDTDYGDTLQTPVSLDEVVASQPAPDGYQRCTCKPSVNQCQNNRCYCFKNKLLCGAKCHYSLACVNT